MTNKEPHGTRNAGRRLMGSLVVVYFVIALEVLIMISPFAGFFYAAFNPALLLLARWPATRWLSAFFLPHMVMPPDVALMAIRVAGSVLFVGGAIVFLVCAGQVYIGKLLSRGPVVGGLYRWIRHPQYLALAVTGVGLAILWPRILTAALWAVMVALYDALAMDEEKRMLRKFSDSYRSYMERTGRFVPRVFGKVVERVPFPRRGFPRFVLVLAVWLALSLGAAFAARAYTVARLPLWSNGQVTVLPVLTADRLPVEHRMSDILALPAIKSRLDRGKGAVLVYVVPRNYIMQGMIADTGPKWRLYEHHQTLAMITNWILHPIAHLQGGHAMHGDMGGMAGGASSGGVVRRAIFVRVASASGGNAPADLFAIGAQRTPRFFADVDFHTLKLLTVKDLGPGTGWGLVPTPMF